jgi:uncharacterized protein
MKTIFILILSLFTFINVCGQQTRNVIARDTLKEKSLSSSRQIFWDNLPKATNWTNDYEDLYSNNEQTKLDSIISKFELETTIEIAIVTIDNTKTTKDKFEDLSLHIAKTWGVGKKNKDNGVLIAISKGYRQIRIQNGNGIEKIITDNETKEIIDKYFIPDFKKGKYYDGTLKGLIELIKLLKSKT